MRGVCTKHFMKYAHGFAMLYFAVASTPVPVVSCHLFTYIRQDCFTGIGAIYLVHSYDYPGFISHKFAT